MEGIDVEEQLDTFIARKYSAIGLHKNIGNQTLRQTVMCTGKETEKHKQTDEKNEAKNRADLF